MATATFYPDPHPESTTVDGQVWVAGENKTITNLRATAGSNARDNSGSETLYLQASTTSAQYAMMTRIPLLFDITGLSASAIITGAKLGVYVLGRVDGLSGASSDNSKMVLDDCSPASNTALQASDFNVANWGGHDYGRSAKQADLTDNANNEIVINTNGTMFIQSARSGDKIVKFGLRYAFDFDITDTGLTWASGAYNYIEFDMAETTAHKPYLEITYTLSGPTYSLVCETGNYFLTGANATLTASRKLICETGNYILTGANATFQRGYTLVCSTGNYILNGISAIFKWTHWTDSAKNNVTPTNLTRTNDASATSSDKNEVSVKNQKRWL